MGRDWFSTPAAVMFATVLTLCSSGSIASTGETTRLASLAAAAPGTTLAPIGLAQGTSSAATTETTVNGTPVSAEASEELVPVGDIPADEEIQPDGLEPPEDAPPPLVPPGDDELPRERDVRNNPYMTPSSATGETAFLPPATKAPEDSVREAATEMVEILGEEAYHRVVNITTPPDTELAEVIRALAEGANLNFVYAEGIIRGRVTLNLRDVPLGVALQSLLSTHDLAIVREGENVMRIVNRKDIRPGVIETKTIFIKLNWVPGQTLENALRNLGGGNHGSIRVHKESNTLIITDTPPNVALVRDLVTQLDVPQKQVMIEARMAELLITNGRQTGANTTLERRDSSNNSGVLGTLGSNGERTVIDRTVTINQETGKPEITEEERTIPAQMVDVVQSTLLGQGPSFTFGGVVSIFGKEFDLSAALSALETKNVVNVLATPRVITLDNQEAMIDIKRELPYLEAQQGVTQNASAASVKFKDAGVRLAVLPTITNNGFVRMRLEPEQLINAGNFFNPTTQSNIPIIDRRSAITNVIVKDEDTVVLGGLREIDSSLNKSQSPWLGQVPILGHFFKASNKAMLKNDLMLFVTPHIVKAPILTPAENYKFTRIDAHWDLPDFFFDDSVEIRDARHRGEIDHNASGYVPQSLKLPPPVDTMEVTTETLEMASDGSELEK